MMQWNDSQSFRKDAEHILRCIAAWLGESLSENQWEDAEAATCLLLEHADKFDEQLKLITEEYFVELRKNNAVHYSSHSSMHDVAMTYGQRGRPSLRYLSMEELEQLVDRVGSSGLAFDIANRLVNEDGTPEYHVHY